VWLRLRSIDDVFRVCEALVVEIADKLTITVQLGPRVHEQLRYMGLSAVLIELLFYISFRQGSATSSYVTSQAREALPHMESSQKKKKKKKSFLGENKASWNVQPLLDHVAVFGFRR
jgi:hypothetical protein